MFAITLMLLLFRPFADMLLLPLMFTLTLR